MVKMKETEMVKQGVAFRNCISDTNCSLEDIIRIYIERRVSDHFHNASEIRGGVPHRKKIES